MKIAHGIAVVCPDRRSFKLPILNGTVPMIIMQPDGRFRWLRIDAPNCKARLFLLSTALLIGMFGGTNHRLHLNHLDA